MKPSRIFLIRHGESEGNVDLNLYAQKPDYQLLLTDKGKLQADEAGRKLNGVIGDQPVRFYISPLWRTRMTFENIVKHFKDVNLISWREDPRLREQEYGHLREKDISDKIENERNKYGTFYYRIKDGENCPDVSDRISDFFATMHRDFEKDDFPENVVIIMHGTSIRLFLMRWFHWTIEEFEMTKNPENCEIFQLSLDYRTGKYHLLNKLKLRDNENNVPMYKWNLSEELYKKHESMSESRFKKFIPKT